MIREIDPGTPIFISSEEGGAPSGFKTLRAVSDPKVIYQFHIFIYYNYLLLASLSLLSFLLLSLFDLV